MTSAPVKSDEPIPGYRLKERIGAGGYGEVWSCEAPGELVKAIKLVYGRLDDDRAARELKAMQRVKSMRHPFLLSLERIEVVDGQLMIVTELAEGSLKDIFDRYRAKKIPGIPADELIKYLRDAADALDYMSEKHSLQHLDVKPENLLMVGGYVKVADFGLVKEIQEVTASIMGGLTPLYAPPEVFDGQPTRLSDQYSLAIVFQEMLTAVLPFPGKTAAQLAAQHLNAKPRLAALPAVYQPIIARALSKKPADRYGSCSELVENLYQARKKEKASSVSYADGNRSPAATESTAQPARRVDLEAETFRIDPDAPVPTATPDETFRTPDRMLSDARLATETASFLLEQEEIAQVPVQEEARPLVDLPPVDFDPTKWVARPTLFIGIGGAGRKALAGLKRRWREHFSAGGPPMHLLAIDVENRGLAEGDDVLDPEETIETPLRKAQDYRRDSNKLSSWLSRRWLFNIPRSQLTDGIRPLGRLALVDHGQRVCQEIEAALSDLIKVDRESSSVNTTGISTMPRVVLVAAIGGGTGGGMLTDVAFAARQSLEQLNCHSSELLLVMAHGTGRNPSTQEITAASAFSTLTELGYFLQPGLGYPGEATCGLKPRQPQQGLLDGAYIVHLGEEMSPKQYRRAISNLSEFLFLESATPTGGYLSAVRMHDDPGQDTLGRRMTIRSISLCQLGFSQDELITQLAESVCRETISRWIGTPKLDTTTSNNTPNLLQPSRNSSSVAAEVDSQIEEVARGMVVAFQIDERHLCDIVEEMLFEQLGNREDFIQSLIANEDPHAAPGEQDMPPLLRANHVFGERDEQGELPESANAPLRKALSEKARKLSRPIGERLRHGLEQVVETPRMRIYGATRAARFIVSHLRSLADLMRQTRSQLTQEILALESWMCPQADPRQRKRNPADEEAYRRLYCEKRIDDAVAATVQQIIAALQGYVGQTSDQLVDLERELRGWQDQFQRLEAPQEVEEVKEQLGEEEAVIEASSFTETCPLDSVRDLLLRELQQRVGTLANAIDQRVTADVFASNGGMRGVLLKGGLLRNQLADTVRQHARRGVLHLLKTIDIQRLLVDGIPGQAVKSNLFGEIVLAAQPWLQSLGGNRRVICITPPEHAAKWNAEKVAKLVNSHGFSSQPAVLTNCGPDGVLLYDLGNLSLRRIANAFIDSRVDLAELGKRLHTRTDIPWQPLPM